MIQTYIPYYKRLLTLAIPLVLTQTGQVVVALVDNAMVGRVGTQELAAASFANSVFAVIMVFGMGMAFAITPLVGQAIGAHDAEGVKSMIKNGGILGLLSAIVLGFLCWSCSWIMPYLGQPEEVLTLAIPYFRILAISLLPFMLFMILKQIGEGLGNTVMAMVATLISNVVNIFLNWVLIFGNWGAPELGLNGAGIATLIARVILPVILFFSFLKAPAIRKYFDFSGLTSVSFQKVTQLLALGLPIGFQLVLETSIFAIGAVMMGWLGDVPLASHQVALGMASLTFMISNGVAQATTIRVSYQIGEKNAEGLRMVSYSAMHLVLLFMTFCGLGFYLFRYDLPRIFTPDELVINSAASLLVLAGIFQIFDGLQVVCLGILRGMTDVKVPMVLAGFSYLVIGLPVSYFAAFSMEMGAEGIWVGFVVGLGLAGLSLYFRIWKRLQRYQKVL
ncbi:MATE family efflux transporter [Persicobacter diffluens]|uniref:Multidrug-efflux transporter n=1 Tax=Persicobacter diffluens TaxID=981 RepID=A0AAN5AL11_9BACT|nr:MATE family efflux transporter [Persicobacter diffluens]